MPTSAAALPASNWKQPQRRDPRPALKALHQKLETEAAAKRFLKKTRLNMTNGCLDWTAAVDTHGYGRFRVGAKVEPSHRAAYRLFCGPIEHGENILHTWGNKDCVNPQHLQKVLKPGFSGPKSAPLSTPPLHRALQDLSALQVEKVWFNRGHIAGFLRVSVRNVLDLTPLSPPQPVPLIIHTDGACSGNGTSSAFGGWAVVFSDGRADLSGTCAEPGVTNIRMEITAAIEALKAVPERTKLALRSDLEMLFKTMAGGWKTKANLDLWTQLKGLAAEREVTWEWVRGHNCNVENERVDALARSQANRGRS